MKRRFKAGMAAWILSAALTLNLAPVIAYAESADNWEETAAEVDNETDSQDVSAGQEQEDNEEGSDLNGEQEGEEEGSDLNVGEENEEDSPTPDPSQEDDESEELLGDDVAELDAAEEDKEYVVYSGHVQTYGDKEAVSDGESFGTTGESKRLEALRVQKGSALEEVEGEIVYRVHVQTFGTMEWVKDGEMAGTSGKAKRLEAIQLYLTGELAEQYDIYYMTHVQKFGWTKWVKGSEMEEGWCGSSGHGLRLEAIRIQLVKKGEAPPAEEGGVTGYVTQKNLASVTYSGHQQTYGDLGAVSDGKELGVTGRSKRLEALYVSLQSEAGFSGSVRYQTHIQGIGWQNWVADNAMAGTRGQSRRMEAIKIELSGELARYCDVWYRVHVQKYGWLGWAKNGQTAGTTDLSYRMEALQVKVVPKWKAAPGANSGYYHTMSPEQKRVKNALQSVYNQVGKNLYSCYKWCVNHIRYKSLGNHVPSGYTNTQWFALYGLEQGYGDCRTYAAAFYQLAKGMGYNARYVYGYVPRRGGGKIDHAWVEIDMGGTTYVFDPDFQYETGRNGYQFRYGASGTWRYSDYHYED